MLPLASSLRRRAPRIVQIALMVVPLALPSFAALPGQVIRYRPGNEEIIAPHVTDAVAVGVIDYGYEMGAILRPDGTLVAYGQSWSGPLQIPDGLNDVVKIDGGNPVVIALRRNGTVATFPAVTVNGFSFVPPAGLNNVVDVGSGYSRCFALLASGTLVGWGEFGSVPAGLNNVKAISIGDGGYNLALKQDGTVVGWVSGNWSISPSVPAGLANVVEVSAGYSHGLALRDDGTVVAWGAPAAAVAVPAGLDDVIQVLAVQDYSYALRRTGEVVAWGRGFFGGSPPVAEGNPGIARLAGGRDSTYAIVGPRWLDRPAALSLAAGYDVTFGAAADLPAGATVQWLHDDAPIAGATAATLTLAAAQHHQGGSYRARISAGGATTHSAVAELQVERGHGRGTWLANVSTRGLTGPGERTLIVGFASEASGGAREIYLRGVGPALAGFGVPGALDDPTLALFRGGQEIAANDDWVWQDPTGYHSDARVVGAFPLAQSSKDAALKTTVLNGPSSVLIRSKGDATGIVLAECYDYSLALELPNVLYGGEVTGQIVNLSSRGVVGTGAEQLIAGFVLRGRGPQRVLLRGVGPGLAPYGIVNYVRDTRLQLFRGNQLLYENIGWETGPLAAEARERTRGFGATPLETGQPDSALVLDLQPGIYSILLAPAAADSGIGLIEIFEIDE